MHKDGIPSLTDSFNCPVTFVERLLGAGDTNMNRGALSSRKPSQELNRCLGRDTS